MPDMRDCQMADSRIIQLVSYSHPSHPNHAVICPRGTSTDVMAVQDLLPTILFIGIAFIVFRWLAGRTYPP